MASFWGEIRRRKLFQVAAAYAIVGWLVAQVAATTFPILLLPDWILRAFIIVLLLGFPIAVVLAWAFEKTPEGIQRDTGATPTAEKQTSSGNSSLYAAGALIVGAMLGGLFGRTTTGPDVVVSSTRTPIQLTANPPDRPVVGSSISPDGQYLAYAEPDALFIRAVESGEAHRLAIPSDGPIRFSNPDIDWYPSGTHLIVSARSGAETGLYRVPVVGGGARRILQEAIMATVSPDGQSIAYYPKLFQGKVMLVGPDGENPTTLIDLPNHSISTLSWSPDSRFLLAGGWITTTEREMHLFAVDVASGQHHTVLSDDRTFQNWRGHLPVTWLPDNRIVYARRELPPSDQMSNLWQVAIDPVTARVAGEPIRLTSLTGYNFRDLSITADGERIAFVIEENQPDVYVADIENGGRQLANIRQLTFDERFDLPAGWSPDSGDVYFRSERGVDENVYAKNLASGDLTVLSGTLQDAHDAVQQSPGGRWLLYWEDDAERVGLYRVPVGGGPSELVLEGTRYSDFDCPHVVDANSTCIVSRSESTNRLTYYAFDPEYGLGRELFEIDLYPPFSNWALSPDRRRLAMVHNLGMIRVFDIESMNEQTITNANYRFGEFVDWTADGEGLILDAYTGNEPRMKSIVFVDVASEEVVILRDEPNQWHVRTYVSPDGEKVAFGLMKFSGNAWMIENP
jgi:Tol biopolymer transport system component